MLLFNIIILLMLLLILSFYTSDIASIIFYVQSLSFNSDVDGVWKFFIFRSTYK